MFSKIKEKFKSKPSLYYSMSIAATWAGVGSLMMGVEMAQTYGIIPFLLWAFGNVLACIVFGVLAPRIPKLRDVFRSRPMKIIVGLMCPFQIWISLNGIQSVFRETTMSNAGLYIAYGLAIFFIILLIKYGLVRNVLTDHYGWIAVYLIIAGLTACSIAYSHGNMNVLNTGIDNIPIGLQKCILMIPGAFLYPYFFELLDYNENNQDGTRHINIQKAFVVGGGLFGIYLIFTFILAWTNFSPTLNIVKAFLIVLIAASSLSSFQYSIYLTFGREVGLFINIATVAFWQILMPYGVMGVWTLMSTIRICIVLISIAVALSWNYASKRKAVRL